MKKWFVLSRRTILSKRNVTQSFGSDNVIVIPKSVIDAVENVYSKQYDERGKIAKEFLDYLSTFETKKLLKGVKQKNGSTLQVIFDSEYRNEKIPDKIVTKDKDPLKVNLLKCCLFLQNKIGEGEKVILVSKSTSLRMDADLAGIEAQTFKDEFLPEISEQYTGRVEVTVTAEMINEFYDNKNKISLESVKKMNEKQEFYPNMFVVMKCNSNKAFGRVQGNFIVGLVHHKNYPYRVTPKNIGQKFMIEALMMDEEIAPLVIIKGPAGTAKTFLSLAAGLEHLENGKFKNNILISRSPTETGEKIGFLPGDETDKIGPYLRGVMDNLKILSSGVKDRKNNDASSKEEIEKGSEKKKNNKNDASHNGKAKKESAMRFFDEGIINAEAVGFIRGRSICDTYIIIDEAQNLTPTEVKTIITRVGEGTKLILIGDPAQIDRPELSERNNGISYASEMLKGESTCWQITMKDEESVRSELAKRASMLL